MDVLDAQDQVVLSGLSDGADISGVKANAVQLRATLVTKDSRVSPSLEFWHVSYTTEQEVRGRLCGWVGSAADGKGIGGAEVAALARGVERARTTTAPDGHYSFRRLRRGTCDVRIARDGFLARELKGVRVPSGCPHNSLLHRAAEVEGKRFTLWSASPMRNLFKEDKPPKDKATRDIRIEAARNEYEPAQIALTTHDEPLSGVRVDVGDLRHSDGRHAIKAARIETNFVGYVSVWKNSPSVPDDELAAKAPRDFPDPLLLDETMDIPKNTTQPVWITVRVPKSARPGDYVGDVRITTAYGGSTMKLHLHVWPFALSDSSHTWMGHGGSGWGQVHSKYRVEGTDEERWKIIRMALKNRAEHRENVIYTDASVFDLVRVIAKPDGSWEYRFGGLDKWVETVLEVYGRRRVMIEFGCFASRKGWTASEIHFNGCRVYNEHGSECPAKSIKSGTSTDSPEFKRFAAPFFAALQEHLEKRGWLDICYTRLQDEPLAQCLAPYKRLCETVHNAAPKLRRFEAIQITGLADHLEIQDAQMDWFDRNLDYFLASQRRGRRVWFYTCWMPRGRYPCRLIDYPLIKHRIIHWMVYFHQVDGYDRYGWACWHRGEPYEETGSLAPGDSYCVYPDPEKKRIINSLRWEMMRESVEDYEYLWLLSDATRRAAKRLGARKGEFDPIAPSLEICARAVRSCTDYERDPERLMALRWEIAEAIVKMNSRPLTLLKTRPGRDPAERRPER